MALNYKYISVGRDRVIAGERMASSNSAFHSWEWGGGGGGGGLRGSLKCLLAFFASVPEIDQDENISGQFWHL